MTGGSQGLGKAIAKELVLRGANVTIVARTVTKLQEAVAELSDSKIHEDQQVSFESVDLTSYESVHSMIERLPFCPDHVVHCAGSCIPGFFTELDPSVFEKQMRQNYLASVYVCHAAIRRMKEISPSYSRRILLVGSLLSSLPIIGYSAYSPVKAAVRNLADSLRQECILYDIEVSVYLPSTILSPGYEQENTLKPELVLQMEGMDSVQTCEEAASHCMTGLDRGDFLIANESTGHLMKNHCRNSSPHDNPILEYLFALVSLLAWPFYRRKLDSLVYQYALEKGYRQPSSSRNSWIFTLLLTFTQLTIFYLSLNCLIENPYRMLRNTFPIWFIMQTLQIYIQSPRPPLTPKRLLAGAASMLIGSLLISFILVAFGAPLLHDFHLTYFCALTLSVFTVYPLASTLAFNTEQWQRFLTLKSFNVIGSMQLRSWGPIIGAWFGAFPIPLDWDRPWQAWPITIVIGAFLGYAFAAIVGEILQ